MATDSNAGSDRTCCDAYQTSRRSILRGALGVGAGLAVTQVFGDSFLEASYAGVAGGNTLVVLSLRGGVDGLGVVVPHGDAGYYKARPTTAVAKDAVVCADSMFGLHPRLAPLKPFWEAGQLAAVHAVGLPVPNRSHFSAIEAVEDAAPGSQARTGWINRMVGLGDPASSAGAFDAVQLGQPYPTTATRGPSPSLAAATLDNLQFTGMDATNRAGRYASLGAAWTGSSGSLGRAGRDAIAISQTSSTRISSVPLGDGYPAAGLAAPFARPLRHAARLIKADVGTDVIAIDAGSWDFHNGYGNVAGGQMQASLDGLAQSLAAFLTDLGALRSRVTVVTISEFGRRVAENGSQGFDHGWGNMMLVAGAGVKGGKYYGTWPGLGASVLAEGDLQVTTDYRNVLGEIVSRRFPDRSVSSLFPGFSYRPLGMMAQV